MAKKQKDIIPVSTAPKRVVIYIRVSTQEQAKEGYSIEAQREKLLAYCKARGWQVVAVIVDPGYSGSNLDRPGIQELISNITNYDVVLVYKLDRLSRSQMDTLHLIEHVFLPNGVDFISMSESFDTSTPFGRAVIGILSVFAQLERETIKERMDMGRVERVKEGKFQGGNAPIGYDYDPETGTLVVNEYEAMQVRMVFDLYIGTPDRPGIGFRKISEIMQEKGFTTKYGDWRHSRTVTTTIQNRAYLGEIHYRDHVVTNAHEPIISQDVFDRAQALRVSRDEKHKGATRSNMLLTGFLWCSCCGARCACVKRGENKRKYSVYTDRYYVCYSRLKVSKSMVKDPNCPSRSWRQQDLDAVIDYEIRNLVFDKTYLRRLIEKNDDVVQTDDHVEIAMRQINAIDRQIERVMDLYQAETIPVEVLNTRINKLYAERSTLQAVVESAAAESPESQTEESTRAYLDDVGEIWDKATIAEKREILSVLVDKVYIGDDNTVKIDWAFL